jgi:hypothetical protein
LDDRADKSDPSRIALALPRQRDVHHHQRRRASRPSVDQGEHPFENERMSTAHQLWQGRVHTHIGRLRDATWHHSPEWHALATVSPAIHDEIRRLLDAYADAPEGPRTAP